MMKPFRNSLSMLFFLFLFYSAANAQKMQEDYRQALLLSVKLDSLAADSFAVHSFSPRTDPTDILAVPIYHYWTDAKGRPHKILVETITRIDTSMVTYYMEFGRLVFASEVIKPRAAGAAYWRADYVFNEKGELLHLSATGRGAKKLPKDKKEAFDEDEPYRGDDLDWKPSVMIPSRFRGAVARVQMHRSHNRASGTRQPAQKPTGQHISAAQ